MAVFVRHLLDLFLAQIAGLRAGVARRCPQVSNNSTRLGGVDLQRDLLGSGAAAT